MNVKEETAAHGLAPPPTPPSPRPQPRASAGLLVAGRLMVAAGDAADHKKYNEGKQ